MWLIAFTWFVLLVGTGFVFPYFGLYLTQTAKLTGTEAGFVLATIPIVSVFVQPLLAALSDRSGARTRVLSGLAFASACALLLIYRASGFWPLVLATALYAACSVTLAPGLWAVSFALISAISPRAMGYARGAGTLGFGVAVVSFPWLSSWLSTSGIIPSSHSALSSIFPLAALATLIAAFAFSRLPRTAEATRRASMKELATIAKNGPFLRLLLLMFLAFFCFHGPTIFFPVLIQAHGGGVGAISHMWLLMLVLEVPLVLSFGWSVSKLGVRWVVFIGLLAGALRWLLTGWLTDMTWISFVQVLHGVTVWGTVLGGTTYADRQVQANQRSTAQSLVSVVSAGLGGMCSSFASGWLVDHLGPQAPALFGGGLGLLIALSVWWLLPEQRVAESTQG